jgi:hypothetical protein
MRRLVFVALLLAASAALLGELAPEVYQEMQRNAPELLQLEVTSVDVDRELRKPRGCPFFEFEVERHVTVDAKVLAVVRSRTGVRPGAVIRIAYTSTRRCSGWNGAGPIPVLAKKARVYAYLAKAEEGFAPAAWGASFTDRR